MGITFVEAFAEGYKPIYWALPIIVIIILILWQWCKRKSDRRCTGVASSSLFIAKFDNDTIGSTPAPSTPGHYGPPGASLNISGASDTIEIVDSATLGSQALKLTRGPFNPYEEEDPTIVCAVVGDIGSMPYTSGVSYIEFRAHGESIPDIDCAATQISVQSKEGHSALFLILHHDSYHLHEGGAFVRIDGSYDPSTAHFVHIEVDLDTRRYMICINEKVVASNKAFIDNDFTNLHTLKFTLGQTIMESFPTVYVVDEIRMS